MHIYTRFVAFVPLFRLDGHPRNQKMKKIAVNLNVVSMKIVKIEITIVFIYVYS